MNRDKSDVLKNHEQNKGSYTGHWKDRLWVDHHNTSKYHSAHLDDIEYSTCNHTPRTKRSLEKAVNLLLLS